jgi:hypothetical protein
MTVEAIFQQIILGPALDCQSGDIFVLRSAQDQNWNADRYAAQRVEGLDALAIGQEKIDHDGCYRFPSWANESIACSGASTYPLDIEGTVARPGESPSNRPGFRGVR